MPTERHRLEGVGYPYAIIQMEGPEFGTRLHSRDIKPLAKTASCQAPHFQHHVAGKLAIRMDDGTVRNEVIKGRFIEDQRASPFCDYSGTK